MTIPEADIATLPKPGGLRLFRKPGGLRLFREGDIAARRTHYRALARRVVLAVPEGRGWR